jgi:phospholipid/cholesterol/gamma-HCH transport system substrate-binding protein
MPRARITRLGSRVRAPLVHTANRLQGQKLVLGALVLAVGAFFAYVSAIAVNGVPFEDRYLVNAELPGDVPPIKVSDEVRIAGQRAGVVHTVEPLPDGVVAGLELDPEFAPIHSDASIDVRVKLTTSLVYLNLDPGTGDDLPEGGTISAEQVELSSTLPQAVETFDEKTRLAAGRTIEVAGLGLRGRGRDMNVGLQDLSTVAEDGTPLVDALTPRPGDLEGFVDGARRTLRGLEGRQPGDLAAMLPAARSTLEALASRQDELGSAVERLRPVEDQALLTLPLSDPLLDDLASSATRLEPGLRSLRDALPDVNRVLASSDSFRRHTADFTHAADPALKAAAPALASLLEPIVTVKPIGKALGPAIELIGRYRAEIEGFGRGLIATTGRPYAGGGTAQGNPAWRFSPILTCHTHRNPFPKPGKVGKDKAPC